MINNLTNRFLSLLVVVTISIMVLGGCVSMKADSDGNVHSFDEGLMNVEYSHQEEHWGDKIYYTDGEIDNSSFILYTFKAEIDDTDILRSWKDSDLNFNLNLNTNRKPGDYDSIGFSLKPEGFSKVYIVLNQDSNGDNLSFSLEVSLDDGNWQEIRIPINSFLPDKKGTGIDMAKSVRISFSIPFLENYHLYHFRSGNLIHGKLSVDNVGFYRIKDRNQTDLGFIDGFNDDLLGIAFTGEIAEASYYVDYSNNDGVVVRTPGIKASSIRMIRSQNGITGDYFKILCNLDVTDELKKLFDSGQNLNVVIRGTIGRSFKGFNAIRFYVRSNGVSEGQIEFEDTDNNVYYESTFKVSESWGRVVIPYEKVLSHIILTLSFPVNEDIIKNGLKTGSINFEIGLDEFSLE